MQFAEAFIQSKFHCIQTFYQFIHSIRIEPMTVVLIAHSSFLSYNLRGLVHDKLVQRDTNFTGFLQSWKIENMEKY